MTRGGGPSHPANAWSLASVNEGHLSNSRKVVNFGRCQLEGWVWVWCREGSRSGLVRRVVASHCALFVILSRVYEVSFLASARRSNRGRFGLP